VRNLRTVEVLIDREAVQNGAAASGTPWQYFDLGHGYCTYNFFEQCPHRMACARCDFYLLKASTRAQLVEAKGHLQRMTNGSPSSTIRFSPTAPWIDSPTAPIISSWRARASEPLAPRALPKAGESPREGGSQDMADRFRIDPSASWTTC
jgi:hypothetical protein